MTDTAVAYARKCEALEHALGPLVLAALADPQVVEVLANPDGRIVVDRLAAGRCDTGATLTGAARERVIRLVADFVGQEVSANTPTLAGVLPTGERFQGLLPPVCAHPAFAIRKRPAVIWTLDDYVAAGVVAPPQAVVLRDAVTRRRNIVIAGGAGAGKTTLANAVLSEPAFASDRVIVIEDTPELQCSAWDLVSTLTRRSPAPIGVGDLVREALRMRPDRIVVGELRDGAAALETLKAWNTGHPGGLTTVHANAATDVLRRVQDLLLEVMVAESGRALTQAIDLIVHVRRIGGERRIDILRPGHGPDPV